MSDAGSSGPPDGEPGRLSGRLIHDGRIVHLSIDEVRFPDGSTGELEMIRHPGASAVIPFTGTPADPDPEILMVHQYRYAAGGFLYEIPAGLPHPGESWEACAHRELQEETGWHTANLRYLTSVRTTPGFTDECIRLFAAWDLTWGEVDPDDDEFIEVVAIPLSRAVGMVKDGEITDGKTMAALLFAQAFRDGWK
ncbi:MAG: NUDIX hydrolase [Gemmatimonadota bacterium]